MAVPCDITNGEQATQFIHQVIDRWGTIDVLVNNAGIIQTGPIECMNREDFERAMATHFWGPLYLIEAALPAMRSQGEGRIVNISSIGGEIGVPHLVPYCASKFALVGLSEGLAAELAKDGIRVTTVCPGLMRTGSPRNAEFKGNHRAEYAWFSIGGSLPILSICSSTAARRIVSACRRGVSYVRLSIPAQVGVRARALFPRLVGLALRTTNRLLPSPNANTRAYRGHESFSKWSPSPLTYLTERAAERNNEVGAARS
jgi:NAD(P)-dependent dehydrogenase (short-subunit alcohol dehydrogenase family)